jgi:hypothetical protein
MRNADGGGQQYGKLKLETPKNYTAASSTVFEAGDAEPLPSEIVRVIQLGERIDIIVRVTGGSPISGVVSRLERFPIRLRNRRS